MLPLVFTTNTGGQYGEAAKVSSSVVRDSLCRSGPGKAFLRDDSWMQDEEGRLRRCRRCDVRLPGGARRCRWILCEAAIPTTHPKLLHGLPPLLCRVVRHA